MLKTSHGSATVDSGSADFGSADSVFVDSNLSSTSSESQGDKKFGSHLSILLLILVCQNPRRDV